MGEISKPATTKIFQRTCGFLVFVAFSSFLISVLKFNSVGMEWEGGVGATTYLFAIAFALIPALITYFIIGKAIPYSHRLSAMSASGMSWKSNLIGAVLIAAVGAGVGFEFSNLVVAKNNAKVAAKEVAEKQKIAEENQTKLKAAEAQESELKRVAALTPAERAAEVQAVKDKQAAATAKQVMEQSQWTYGNYVDKLTGEKQERFAELASDNVLKLKFPYNGGGTATLRVFYINKNGPFAEIILSRGMFGGGHTRVRFDEERAVDFDGFMACTYGDENEKRFSVTRCHYHAPKQDFFVKLKTSKHVKFELPIYDNGFQILEFSTAGLDPSILPEEKPRLPKNKN